jgi:hypothetical protein
MKKSNYIKPNSNDEANILNEPAMVYGYANQSNYESTLIERVDEVTPKPQKILQPDDDLRRAISGEEFKRRVLLMVEELDKKYAKR